MWVFITITNELAQPAWTEFTPSVPMCLGGFCADRLQDFSTVLLAPASMRSA